MLSPNPLILCVDDDPDSCELMSLMLNLEDDNYQVKTVSTAPEALSLMEKQPIALFILDWFLPAMSGVELCRRIRRTNPRIPIMFYTAMAREVDRDEALRAGATEYLIKPNDLDRFTQTVRRLLNESPVMFESTSSGKTAAPDYSSQKLFEN